MKRSRKSPPARPEVCIFVSYSHRDLFWMQKLMPLLTFPGVKAKAWNDEKIRAGMPWDKEIKDALAEMDVFVPLVSVHFALSNYIGKVESPIAKKRHGSGEIEVAPVLVDHPGREECAWLMRLQRVPPGAKSWVQVFEEFEHYDKALAPIREGIREVVDRARQRKLRKKP